MRQHHDTESYRAFQPSVTRGEAGSLFGQTMALVAVTSGLFALGAYLGRGLSGGWGLIFFIASFGCLIALNFSVRQSEQLTLGLLFGFGLLMGLAVSPTIADYANADPQVVWQAGGATALFIAGFGAAGYATRHDLSKLARTLSWALVGLIAFGIVLIFTSIPNGLLVYAIVGLAIFAGWTMVDFQRLRIGKDIESAPFLAASIFLDVVNVLQLFLMLFGRRRRL
jgi:FtsH-binding integral membrane protein